MTVLEGFDAMRIFLEAAWLRQGKDAKEIAFVLGGSRWVDGTVADPTIWEDWLMAVQTSTRRLRPATIKCAARQSAELICPFSAIGEGRVGAHPVRAIPALVNDLSNLVSSSDPIAEHALVLPLTFRLKYYGTGLRDDECY